MSKPYEISPVPDDAVGSKAGYEPEEMEVLTSKARNIQLLRKSMLADRLHASKPEIENKVRANAGILATALMDGGKEEEEDED